MARGYAGKLLQVDLSGRHIESEHLDERRARLFVGGYGLGASLLFQRIPKGADPLGSDNILGILTGPLTGTPALAASRWVAVCKSPLTNGWGDANCGGTLGPHLKMAGYDGVLFSGTSDHPVYLWIDRGRAELRDASHLWGMDTNQAEDAIKAELGSQTDVHVATIGPAGEKLSRIAAIINDYGRAAGRSGVGAVMGAKRLKAIAVRGDRPVAVHDENAIRALRKDYSKRPCGMYEMLRSTGTPGAIANLIVANRSPVKNWSGVGIVDFPEGIEEYDADRVLGYRKGRYACRKCSIGCGGEMQVEEACDYQGVRHHQPEYETGAAFGSMTLMANVPALIRINELCSRYGFDTISAGGTIAFAIECFENGILTESDTDGLVLRWGDDTAIIKLLERMALRRGIGDVLAEGTWRAAQRIGKGAEQFAMHIGGQELPMHDPRYLPGYMLSYTMNATPARHTQGGDASRPIGMNLRKYDAMSLDPHNRADVHTAVANFVYLMNASGICQFGANSYDHSCVPDFLQAVTGWEWGDETVQITGERIGTMRHLFNLRECINPLEYHVPGRVYGDPPLTAGPLTGRTVDYRTMQREYLEYVDWDPVTTVPNVSKLNALGLEQFVSIFHPTDRTF